MGAMLRMTHTKPCKNHYILRVKRLGLGLEGFCIAEVKITSSGLTQQTASV